MPVCDAAVMYAYIYIYVIHTYMPLNMNVKYLEGLIYLKYN